MTRGPPSERSPAELLEFGVVNLDKPPGPSAHQVVAWLRDMVGLDRAAHAGTLDPKVTGSLPVLLGDATRMAQVFDDAVVTVAVDRGTEPAGVHGDDLHVGQDVRDDVDDRIEPLDVADCEWDVRHGGVSDQVAPV